MEAPLKVIDLVKTFSLGKVKVHALRGISFEVQRGRMVAIMGPSGSGKSTLLNIIGTLDRPTMGEVYLEGRPLFKMPESFLSLVRCKRIGFIFQFYNLIPILTAYENIEFPMLIAGHTKKYIRRRVLKLLKMVGLEDRVNHRPDEMSGGEQQRVAIARALANHPTIILADEPTGDLDYKSGIKVVKILKKLAIEEGTTVIMVTHDMQVASLADEVMRIRDGRIVEKKILKN